MNELSGQYSVKAISEALDIDRSGHYRKRNHGPRAQEHLILSQEVTRIYREHDSRYGSPRIHMQLKDEGHQCGKKRVERLMRENDLHAICPKRKAPRTTDSRHGGPIAPNQLKEMTVSRPHEVWAMDITYVRTGTTWCYLAGVLDLYLHKIVGWDVSETIDSRLVEKALLQAVSRQHSPEQVIVHSDRGVQYASSAFIGLVSSLNYLRSMSAKGNCYDNAAMESFFGVIKREELNRWHFPCRESLRSHVFDYIETYYNRKRIHTAIGMPPERFEALEKIRLEESMAACPPGADQPRAGRGLATEAQKEYIMK